MAVPRYGEARWHSRDGAQVGRVGGDLGGVRAGSVSESGREHLARGTHPAPAASIAVACTSDGLGTQRSAHGQKLAVAGIWSDGGGRTLYHPDLCLVRGLREGNVG